MRAAFSLAPLPNLEIAVATGFLEAGVNDRVSYSSGDVNAADNTLASDRSGFDGAPAGTSFGDNSSGVKRGSDHNCVNAPTLHGFGLAAVERTALGATAAK
jgi:hypothetical protein